MYKIITTGFCSPYRGKKLFQVLKVHLGMGRIRGLRDKEMAIYGLVMYFCKDLGKRPNFG